MSLIIGPKDFMRKECKRCRRRIEHGEVVCGRCRQIATIIVESCAMNLAAMPVEAFEDAQCDQSVIEAVEKARAAFFESQIALPILQALRDRLTADVARGAAELHEATHGSKES